MEFIPSTELDRRSITDQRTEPKTAGVPERLIELSSWMMVLGTIRLVCTIADYATALLERSRVDPWSARMLVRFIQENHAIVLLSAAWPLLLGVALQRTRWPELLRAAGVTFLILSIGGVLELTAELSETQGRTVTLGAFHLARRAFSHPNPSDVVLGVLGATQLLLELGTAVCVLSLSFQGRRTSAVELEKTERARRARFGRLAVYASFGFLVLMIRMPVWSAYLEVLNKYPLVREFILKNDFDRVRSRRHASKATDEMRSLLQADPFLAMKSNYLRTIAYYDELPPGSLTHPMYRFEMSNTLNNLAWLLATYPDSTRHEPDAAVAYARRAVELAPESGNDWNTLGVAYYRAGKWQDAKSSLERSINLRMGGDSFDWFFLSLVQHKLGRPEEARQWYEKAMHWYHENRRGDPELERFQAEAARELGLPDLGPSQPFPNDKTPQLPLSPPQTLSGSKRLRMRATNLGKVNPSR
jgi:tetratricopeptide (TPR) repeat protein